MIDNTELSEGRWLIASNPEIGAISFRHPDSEAEDSQHIRLGSFESKIIDPLWMEVPWFVNAVETGRVVVSRSDTMPRNELAVARVVDEIVANGWDRHAALTAYHICASDPVPDNLAQYVSLDPSPASKRQFGPTYINNRWDLLKQHLPFLRDVVLPLERRWRNRDWLVVALEMRIEELEKLRV